MDSRTKPHPNHSTLPTAHAHRAAKQARALAALQIKMTPVVKSSAPHVEADAREPAAQPPSKRASLGAAAPAAASLQLLTAAAAAESRDASSLRRTSHSSSLGAEMDSDAEREVRDRGEAAAALMVTLLPLEALEQPVTLGCGHSFELLALQAVSSRSRKGQAALCPASPSPKPSPKPSPTTKPTAGWAAGARRLRHGQRSRTRWRAGMPSARGGQARRGLG